MRVQVNNERTFTVVLTESEARGVLCVKICPDSYTVVSFLEKLTEALEKGDQN